MYRSLISCPWTAVYGEVDPNKEKDKDKGSESKTFTQEQVNAILAKEKRKTEASQQNLLDELQALKARSDLTNQERQDLEARIENIQSTLRTKEQQSEVERKKLEKELKEKTEALTKDAETWKSRYTSSTIQRALIDAAIGNNAFSPEQIVAILQPTTRLVEVLGEDGKPTGNLVPKVKIQDTDAKGQPIELDLTAEEAVKKMHETDRFQNLFKPEGVSGSGLFNNPKVTAKDKLAILRDPKAYREARKKGLI